MLSVSVSIEQTFEEHLLWTRTSVGTGDTLVSNQSRVAALMVGRGTDSKGVTNSMNMTALGRVTAWETIKEALMIESGIEGLGLSQEITLN